MILRNTLIKYTEWLLKKGYINHPAACIDYEIAEQYLDSKASDVVRLSNVSKTGDKALHKHSVKALTKNWM